MKTGDGRRWAGSATTPVLGGSFNVLLDNTPGNSAAALQPIGGGCMQLVSPQAPNVTRIVITTAHGRASVPTTIPNIASPTGLFLYGQNATLDPGGAYLDLAAFSSGVAGLVGP